eukprot:g5641.t1
MQRMFSESSALLGAGEEMDEDLPDERVDDENDDDEQEEVEEEEEEEEEDDDDEEEEEEEEEEADDMKDPAISVDDDEEEEEEEEVEVDEEGGIVPADDDDGLGDEENEARLDALEASTTEVEERLDELEKATAAADAGGLAARSGDIAEAAAAAAAAGARVEGAGSDSDSLLSPRSNDWLRQNLGKLPITAEATAELQQQQPQQQQQQQQQPQPPQPPLSPSQRRMLTQELGGLTQSYGVGVDTSGGAGGRSLTSVERRQMAADLARMRQLAGGV